MSQERCNFSVESNETTPNGKFVRYCKISKDVVCNGMEGKNGCPFWGVSRLHIAKAILDRGGL